MAEPVRDSGEAAQGGEGSAEEHGREQAARLHPRIEEVEEPGGDGVDASGGERADALTDGPVVDDALDAAVEEARHGDGSASVEPAGKARQAGVAPGGDDDP